MKTEIINNSYEGGKRVVMQKVTFEKSDDLYALANLHARHERIVKQLEEATAETTIARLRAEKEKLEAEISEREGYVSGYDDNE